MRIALLSLGLAVVINVVGCQPQSKTDTSGGSALGRIQLETAIEKPPHLVCAVPLIAPLGQRYEDFYEGGILLEAHVNMLDKLGFGVGTIVKQFPNADAPAWALAKRATYKPESIDVPCLFITGWWDNYPASILSELRRRPREGRRQGSTIEAPGRPLGPCQHRR